MFSTSSRNSTHSTGITEWAYLRDLSKHASSATYRSHKTAVQQFGAWYRDHDQNGAGLNAETVARFLIGLTEQSEKSHATVDSYLDILSNLVAYHQHDAPAIVTARILDAFDQWNQGDPNIERPAYNQPEETRKAVEVFLAGLRSQKFGTRLHAFVETIIATQSLPEQVRQLDLTDIDLDESTASVGIPDESIVGKAELVTTRSAELEYEAVEALSSYVSYERESPNCDSAPLFTTTKGRVAPSTLRRSIKATSKTILASSSQNDERGERHAESGRTTKHVTLTDIRQFALTEVGQDDV